MIQLNVPSLGAATLQSITTTRKPAMPLGIFSTSLAVKDIKASITFYEKLDFKKVAGQIEQNWIILQNGNTTIGLFQGMFEHNIMTSTARATNTAAVAAQRAAGPRDAEPCAGVLEVGVISGEYTLEVSAHVPGDHEETLHVDFRCSISGARTVSPTTEA